MAGTSSVDFHLGGRDGRRADPSNLKMRSGRGGSVRVDQNAPKVGLRPRVGIPSSAPSRRAIASVHRGRTCRDFNGREKCSVNARPAVLMRGPAKDTGDQSVLIQPF